MNTDADNGRDYVFYSRRVQGLFRLQHWRVSIDLKAFACIPLWRRYMYRIPWRITFTYRLITAFETRRHWIAEVRTVSAASAYSENASLYKQHQLIAKMLPGKRRMNKRSSLSHINHCQTTFNEALYQGHQWLHAFLYIGLRMCIIISGAFYSDIHLNAQGIKRWSLQAKS